jgi:serine/threonine protein kinase
VFQSGDILADRFELERLAGAGAMGQVWLARDRESGVPLAVKVLTKADRGEHSVRFLREALLLSQLSHPRIVRYVAHGLMRSGEPYLAMEWLEGEDLAQRLRAGPLTMHETILLVRHVAEALAVAHTAGIVHRDIKPSNLFLPGGSIEAVKVVDFGIARIKDSTWTKTGLMLGTPAYMAPEQACGEREIDARADLFGLGCVAFECVTGRCAFGGTQVFTVLRRILLEEAPSLADAVPTVPPELDALVKRMMAKDPAERPRDASDVAAALAGLGGSTEAPRQSQPRLVLTGREQRIVTVLSVAEAQSLPNTDDSTAVEVLQPSPDRLDPTGTLRSLLERSGGKLGRCTANSFVLVFPPSGVPSDRAAQAAACALSLDGIWPGRAMALATGRTEMTTWTDGHAADRASRLLVGRAGSSKAIHATNILLDEVTAGLLDARFEVGEGPGGLELRGDNERAEHGRSPSSPAASPRTPFVGRERAIAAILATLEQCIEEPVARAVLVTALAGAGKSRLRRELLDDISRHGSAEPRLAADVQIWTARGDPMRAGSPFGLISQLTRCARGVFPSDAAGISGQNQNAWNDFLAVECAAGPVLLVLEDLQWGDSMSMKMLDLALRDLRDSPLMVLAFARPEVHELFPKLWTDREIEEIRLTPLTKSSSERLVRELLGRAVSATEMTTILEQADGVPFYLEALARAAAAGGEKIPDEVIAMVQSRFEELAPDARRVLRAASVFGQAFWRGGVLALLGRSDEIDDRLLDLSEAKLISRQPESRFPDEEEYVFCTALLREGAYAMLTDADRALGHDLAGEWLEQMGEENAAVISGHYERGGRRRSEIVEPHAAR